MSDLRQGIWWGGAGRRHARAVTSNLPHDGRAAADAARVAALVNRYLVSLDDEELDEAWASGLFTEDAVVAFPMSRHEGIGGLARWHRAALSVFEATQHLGSPAVVDVDGGRAVFRAHVLTTHVHRGGAGLFRAGTLARGEARRTRGGWRLASLSLRVLFTEGSPPRRE
ncbi:SnoaL-like protein [Streptomyces sp. T12]|nr:SnoaL-like protein [Streptomyces sp. T12]